MEHHKCRSYNLNVHTKECQLNERRFGENSTQLVDAPGWLYKSTDYSKKLVRTVCCYLFEFMLDEKSLLTSS